MLRLIALSVVLAVAWVVAPHADAEPSFHASDVRITPADTTKTEQKKRQKKRDASTADQQKDTNTYTETGTTTKTDDDESFMDACLGGCIAVFFESICSGLFGTDTPQATSTASTTSLDDADQTGTGTTDGTVAPATAAALIALPYAAVLKPMNPYDEELDLWDISGGAAGGGQVVTALPRGARVDVVGRQTYNNTKWVQVQGPGVPDPGGWLQERDVASRDETAVYQEPGAQNVPVQATRSVPDIRDVRWEILVDLSVPVFPNSMLNEEYKNSFRVGAETRLFFVHSIQVDLSFGYSHSNGEPQYDYVTGNVREAPTDSNLDIWSIGARVGQLFAFPTGNNYFFLSYDLGPTVFNVRESATLEVYEGKEMTGTREETLSEWKFGGDLKLEVGSIIKGQFPISFHTRFSYIPWTANEEKSLTLDFLNDNAIYVLNFGLSFGYMFY